MATPRRAWVRVVATAIIVSGCGVGQPGASHPGASPAPSEAPSPSAAPPRPSSTTTAPAACPNFVEVIETGPLPTDRSEDGPIFRDQARLEADVEAASAYGAAHPDEFASIRYENAPRVRIVIGFTAHLEEHCAALRELLEYPDEFEIIRQPATEARLMEIQQEIVALAGDRLPSVGIGAGTIDVQLRADGESIAEEIRTRYGDVVTITVGMLGYPGRVIGAHGSCADLVTPTTADLPLEATLSLTAPSVRSGDDFEGRVAIRNTGDEAFPFQSGPTQIAQVFRPGSRVPSGLFTSGLDSIGFGQVLGPGESVTLKVLGGTASCDPALGYALPPGPYETRVAVLQLTMHDAAPTESVYLLSGPVPVTIVP